MVVTVGRQLVPDENQQKLTTNVVHGEQNRLAQVNIFGCALDRVRTAPLQYIDVHSTLHTVRAWFYERKKLFSINMSHTRRGLAQHRAYRTYAKPRN
jgi:hypothetical protein